MTDNKDGYPRGVTQPMPTTPPPTQQLDLDSVLSALEQAGTPDAIQLAMSDCALYLRDNAPTLRRALAALEAVEGAEIVAYASKTAWPPMTPKQRERMIADAQYGGEFAMAARTSETFTIPLIAHPFSPADAVEVIRGNETVAYVVQDFDAMATECGGLEAATILAMTARLSAAHAREVKALQSDLRAYMDSTNAEAAARIEAEDRAEALRIRSNALEGCLRGAMTLLQIAPEKHDGVINALVESATKVAAFASGGEG